MIPQVSLYTKLPLLSCSGDFLGGSLLCSKHLGLFLKVSTQYELLEKSAISSAIQVRGSIISKDCMQKEDVAAYFRT